ncbi:MAG TPA: dTMP kinase [Ktedonobacteraceae bacterium]|nr:dTMP kinase [Ktedonobacteraceae bacterium]
MENEQRRISGADAYFNSFATPLLRPEGAKLIVLEGIDLAGRTTQVHLLRDWLSAQKYHVTTTAWRTSPLISDVLARARTKSPLRPLTYSLLYCADHLDRTERVIRPALERGEIVLADRYVYTAFARDEARGLDKQWVRNLYRFTLEPDAVFYLHISPEEAVRRRVALQQRVSLAAKSEKHGAKKQKKLLERAATTVQPPVLAPQTLESFHDFEMNMYSQYQRMQKEFNFTVVEGGQSIDLVQATLRRAVLRLLLEPE